MSRDSIAQATTWNGLAQRMVLGARRATTPAILSAMSAETWVMSAALCSPSSSKNNVQSGLGPAGSGPDETAGVVINHDDQVAVSPFVGDLIDPDPTQTRKEDQPWLQRRC
jgi:hypothetical protein